MMVAWVLAPWRMVNCYECLGERCCFHLQGDGIMSRQTLKWLEGKKWDDYTGCIMKNTYFSKMFLCLNYIDLTKHTYIQSNGDNDEVSFQDWGLLYVYQFHIGYGLKWVGIWGACNFNTCAIHLIDIWVT